MRSAWGLRDGGGIAGQPDRAAHGGRAARMDPVSCVRGAVSGPGGGTGLRPAVSAGVAWVMRIQAGAVKLNAAVPAAADEAPCCGPHRWQSLLRSRARKAPACVVWRNARRLAN